MTLTIGKPAKLTAHGERLITAHMFDKGKGFVGSSILLKRHNGNQAVVLHLLCQGIEILLKAGLLLVDFKKYRPLLKTKMYGHNLEVLARELQNATGLCVFSGESAAEFQALNSLFSKHLLRYASSFDILVSPESIPCDRVIKRVAAAARLCEQRRLFRYQVTP